MSINEDEKVTLDVYWKMYSEHASQARQHETLRGTVSSIIVAVIAALLGLSKNGQNTHFVGWAIVVLALVGALLSIKHYERNRLHARILGAFGEAMNCILGKHNIALSTINQKARERHKKDYRLLSAISLYMLWLCIFLALMMAGLFLARSSLGL
jgi:Na+(H+)/acetate symporter ActP